MVCYSSIPLFLFSFSSFSSFPVYCSFLFLSSFPLIDKEIPCEEETTLQVRRVRVWHNPIRIANRVREERRGGEEGGKRRRREGRRRREEGGKKKEGRRGSEGEGGRKRGERIENCT
jgi:hypothetical protein